MYVSCSSPTAARSRSRSRAIASVLMNGSRSPCAASQRRPYSFAAATIAALSIRPGRVEFESNGDSNSSSMPQSIAVGPVPRPSKPTTSNCESNWKVPGGASRTKSSVPNGWAKKSVPIRLAGSTAGWRINEMSIVSAAWPLMVTRNGRGRALEPVTAVGSTSGRARRFGLGVDARGTAGASAANQQQAGQHAHPEGS